MTASNGKHEESSQLPPASDSVLLPDVWHAVLAEALAATQQEWRRERALFEAQAQAIISDLRAKVVELRQEVADMATARLALVKDGEPGAPGEPGPIGPAGTLGEKGDPGDQGPRGQRGEIGERGLQGQPGERGERGEPGERGTDGAPGERGEPGLLGAPGERGEHGERGEPGPQGERGEPGQPGERGEPGLLGAPGERGTDGLNGNNGAPGEKGERGEPGSPGERGLQGEPGPLGLKGDPGERGAPGDQGPRGQRGEIGERGPQGETGLSVKGDPGERGEPGARGEPGEQGERGEQGEAGLLPVVKAFTPGIVHYRSEVVFFEGGTYQAQRDTGQTPPHADWITLASAGRDGRSPQVCGTFKDDGDYKLLDIVAFNGGSFIARRDDPGPCPGPGWQLLTSPGKRGDKGPQGQRGEKGERGDQGERGATIVIRDWKLDRENYLAVPIMSDGEEGPPLALRGLFEQFQGETH